MTLKTDKSKLCDKKYCPIDCPHWHYISYGRYCKKVNEVLEKKDGKIYRCPSCLRRKNERLQRG